MQRQKDDVRNRILEVAKVTFLEKGYLKASMRSIAELSGVGVGNIYNYFKSKDELLQCILKPVVTRLDKILTEHHGLDGEDITSMLDTSYLKVTTDEYVSLIRDHRVLMKILLFKTEGSSLAGFREKFTDRSTALVKEWFALMKQRHPEVNVEFSNLFIHLHSVWMFALFEEILMHNATNKETERVVAEYINFEIEGWKGLFNLT